MSSSALLDVRPEPHFLASHASGATSIPLEQLATRIHELPPAQTSLRIIDPDPDRARKAALFLQARGHPVEIVAPDSIASTESGPSQNRLWQPNSFLLEALQHIDDLKAGASALDVACGSGRDAVYLALRGYRVLAIDVLPDALQRAGDLARRNGVRISTRQQNLESEPILPDGPFDLVTVFRYLHRPLFPALREAVASGGHIVYETFHQRTRQTGRPPRSAEHLLRDGELPSAFEGFQVLITRDGVERDGRYVSSLLARRT